MTGQVAFPAGDIGPAGFAALAILSVITWGTVNRKITS